MRTLFLSLLLIAVTTIGQAQAIQLEEAKVGFTPLDSKITRNGDEFSYKVDEAYTGEFSKDAIAFMNANFNIRNFIEEVSAENYDAYRVTFTSGKGYLSANFDKEGNLLKTYQKFRDMPLPLDIRREVYMANVGWTMTENKYVASGRGDLIEKEIYKIKLEKGNQKRAMKIDPVKSGISVASND